MEKKEDFKGYSVEYNLLEVQKNLKRKNHKDYYYYLPNLESNSNQN